MDISYPKRKRYPFRTSDSAEMREAIKRLVDLKIYVLRPTAFQLKTKRGVSFYPSTGTIVVDGLGRLPEHGLDALIRYIAPSERRVTSARSRLDLDVSDPRDESSPPFEPLTINLLG